MIILRKREKRGQLSRTPISSAQRKKEEMRHRQNHTLSMGSRLDTTLTGGGEGENQEEKKKTTKLRQATLNWPASRVEPENTTKKKEPAEKGKAEVEEGLWVEGGREEDNERYRAFLKYCEER